MVDADELIDLVKIRLSVFGYTLSENDYPVVRYFTEKIILDVQNNCNLNYIPAGLKYEITDMICGEFLYNRYSSGSLDMESIDFSTVVSSIKEGDMAVSFAVGEQSATPESRFIEAVDYMRNTKGRGFARYRKLRW